MYLRDTLRAAGPQAMRQALGAAFLILLGSMSGPNPASADFTWQEQTLAPFTGKLRDVVADSSEALHLVLTGGNDAIHGLVVGDSIIFDTIMTGSGFGAMDIQVAPNGDLGVLMRAFGDLYFARRTGAAWQSALVDTTTPYSVSLAFDSASNPHAAFSSTDSPGDTSYYCSDQGIGNWSCNSIALLTRTQSAVIAVDASDSVHVVAHMRVGSNPSYLVRGSPPFPTSPLDTIANDFDWSMTLLDLRSLPDGSLRVLSSEYVLDGIDCGDGYARIRERSAGNWSVGGVSAPGEYPFDRTAKSWDFDSMLEPHTLFTRSLGSPFCDNCAFYCTFGPPGPADPCSLYCPTLGMLVYSRVEDSVWVQELIADSKDLGAPFLNLDASDVPRIIAKRGNNIVRLTRDVPTYVADGMGEAGDAGTTNALPASGLRVLVSPNPSTRTFAFAIVPGTPVARIDVFDIRGRMVRSIRSSISDGAAGQAAPGTLTWDGDDASGRAVAKGVYFARFNFGTRTETHKLTVIR